MIPHPTPWSIVAAALLVALLRAPPSARACSFAVNEAHALDLAEVGLDTQAPAAIAEVRTQIIRGRGDDCGAASSCDDLGRVELVVTAGGDDRTPAGSLGYRLVLVDGRLPRGASLPSEPARLSEGRLRIIWIDGASDDQESVSFTLSLIPIDLAGNEGPATTVRVRDAGSGCSAGRVELPVWVLAALALLYARRRRSAQR